MGEGGVLYAEIRKKTQKDFGDPITDYVKLDKGTLDYSNIYEYFFDDFKDL